MYTLMAGPSPFAPRASNRRLVPLVREAVHAAVASLAPGGIAVRRAVVPDAGSNRAVPAWDHCGQAIRNDFLDRGPASGSDRAHPADRLRDPRVTVLVARTDDGSIQAALAWYAVHGTALGAQWPAFGSDLWGIAREEAERDGVFVGFGGGSSGDISPLLVDAYGQLRQSDGGRPSTQGRDLAEVVGRRLGSAVRAAIADSDVQGFSARAAHELWEPRSSGLPGPLRIRLATLTVSPTAVKTAALPNEPILPKIASPQWIPTFSSMVRSSNCGVLCATASSMPRPAWTASRAAVSGGLAWSG